MQASNVLFFRHISIFSQIFSCMQILNNVKKYKYFLIKIFEESLIFLFNIDIKFNEKFILIRLFSVKNNFINEHETRIFL